MHEIIVVIYDDMYGYSVAIDGKELERKKAFDIGADFYYSHDNEIFPLMNKYNCNRLILVINGCIEIYTR